MSSRSFTFLEKLREAAGGNLVYPELRTETPRLMRFQVHIANNIPDNIAGGGSPSANQSEVYFGYGPSIMIADAADMSLSVKEDGSEVWVACHDSDRVYVLRGSDGAVLARIDLPWGSGPVGVALSRDQQHALVTLYRKGAAAAIDVATRQVKSILSPIWHTPRGVTWIEGEQAAWISHVIADGEHTRLTRIDFSGAEPAVDAEVAAWAGKKKPRRSGAHRGGARREGLLPQNWRKLPACIR